MWRPGAASASRPKTESQTMQQATIKRAFTERKGRIVPDGFDLFVGGVWHERFKTKSAAKRHVLYEMPDTSTFVATLRLHYRADYKVTLYMNGKKCMTGEFRDMERVGQKLVDEGSARWSRRGATFAKAITAKAAA